MTIGNFLFLFVGDRVRNTRSGQVGVVRNAGIDYNGQKFVAVSWDGPKGYGGGSWYRTNSGGGWQKDIESLERA